MQSIYSAVTLFVCQLFKCYFSEHLSGDLRKRFVEENHVIEYEIIVAIFSHCAANELKNVVCGQVAQRTLYHACASVLIVDRIRHGNDHHLQHFRVSCNRFFKPGWVGENNTWVLKKKKRKKRKKKEDMKRMYVFNVTFQLISYYLSTMVVPHICNKE